MSAMLAMIAVMATFASEEAVPIRMTGVAPEYCTNAEILKGTVENTSATALLVSVSVEKAANSGEWEEYAADISADEPFPRQVMAFPLSRGQARPIEWRPRPVGRSSERLADGVYRLVANVARSRRSLRRRQRFTVAQFSVGKQGCSPGVATPGVDGGHEAKTELADLSLEVKIEAPEHAPGDTVRLEYVLSNRSQRPVKGCVTGWETYTFQFPRDWVRQFSAPLDGVSEERMFHIPPGMRLGWQAEVKIPENAGVGSASLTGELESDDGGCSYGWHGRIKSAPALFRIAAREPTHSPQAIPKVEPPVKD
jgi:hypothetical protein